MEFDRYPGDGALRAAKQKSKGLYNELEKRFTYSTKVGKCTEICKRLGCVNGTAEDFYYAYHNDGSNAGQITQQNCRDVGRTTDTIWEYARELHRLIEESNIGNPECLTVADCFLMIENHVILETWEGLQPERDFRGYLMTNKYMLDNGWLILEPEENEDKNYNIDIKCYCPADNRYVFFQVKPVTTFIDSNKPEKADAVRSLRNDRFNFFSKESHGRCAYRGSDVMYRYVIYERNYRTGEITWLKDRSRNTLQWRLSDMCSDVDGSMKIDLKKSSDNVKLC